MLHLIMINNIEANKTKEMLRKLEGTHTLVSVMNLLNTDRNKAIYYIHRLRKKGYIKTRKTSEGKRVYYISFENRLGGNSYIDIINKNSPIKLYSSEDFKIYGRSPSFEETLVYCLNSKDFRLILASLALFKKIS